MLLLTQPLDLACGTLFRPSCAIETWLLDYLDDRWRDTFFGKHERGAVWLLICGALEKHLLTYLLTYLLRSYRLWRCQHQCYRSNCARLTKLLWLIHVMLRIFRLSICPSWPVSDGCGSRHENGILWQRGRCEFQPSKSAVYTSSCRRSRVRCRSQQQLTSLSHLSSSIRISCRCYCCSFCCLCRRFVNKALSSALTALKTCTVWVKKSSPP